MSAAEGDLPPLSVMGVSHVRYVRALVSKLGAKPSHEHMDLVQEVLYQAVRSSNPAGLDAKALLAGITRHVVFRWFARQKRAQEAMDEWRGWAEGEQRAESSSGNDAREILDAALLGLKPHQREVIVRVELEGCSVPELARELGIKQNTLHARLHKARLRLAVLVRRELLRRGLEEGDV